MRVALDAAGDTFITGWTGSTNFDTLHATTNFQTFVSPTNSGADVFVTKFDASGTNIVFTSVFGGRLADQGWDIAVDAAGNSFITGYTDSTNFPVAGLDTNSLLRATNSGSRDAFIAELNATGTALVYSAYLGGKGSDAAHAIEIDSAGNAYIVGGTASTNNFPLVSQIGRAHV